MADITQLILDDHDAFRRQFAALDDADPAELRALWDPLAELLEVHAAAEEAIFYPQLLRHGDDAEDETVDAIGDHNDIRDGVREAARHPVGSSKWWDGVWQARRANSDHMAEEEDDALADFRRNTPLSVRDTDDKDPEGYVNAVQAEMSQGETSSLGIGSLKGR
jgi:hypothetical protein